MRQPGSKITFARDISKISGAGQEIIGEIEKIGGVLTGDPNTVAEGEFNVEIREIREELEDQTDAKHDAL